MFRSYQIEQSAIGTIKRKLKDLEEELSLTNIVLKRIGEVVDKTDKELIRNGVPLDSWEAEKKQKIAPYLRRVDELLKQISELEKKVADEISTYEDMLKKATYLTGEESIAELEGMSKGSLEIGNVIDELESLKMKINSLKVDLFTNQSYIRRLIGGEEP